MFAPGGLPEALRRLGGRWNPLSGPPPGVPAGCTARVYYVSGAQLNTTHVT